QRRDDLRRAEDAGRSDRRKPERARAQARGGRVRPVRERIRGAPPAHRVPLDRLRASRPREVPLAHGGVDPRDPQGLAPSRPRSLPTMSPPEPSNGVPRHTAIVMDGNGRWAVRKGRPRVFGHRAGAAAVRRTVEAARAIGLPVLTLYAFSSDNWGRPRAEV